MYIPNCMNSCTRRVKYGASVTCLMPMFWWDRVWSENREQDVDFLLIGEYLKPHAIQDR